MFDRGLGKEEGGVTGRKWGDGGGGGGGGGRWGHDWDKRDYGHWDWSQITRPFPKNGKDVASVQSFLTRCCFLLFAVEKGGAFSFFFFLTSHLAYLHQWFQMWDFTASMRTASQSANKSKAKILNLQGRGGAGGAFRTLKCESFQQDPAVSSPEGRLLLIDGLSEWWEGGALWPTETD